MSRLVAAVSYVLWLLYQIPRNAIRLAVDVFSPGLFVSPSIIEFPLRARTPFELAAIESSITITPGTLTIGIAPPEAEGEPKTLFVHFLYAHSHADAVAELEDMESRLLRATRGPGFERHPRRGGDVGNGAEGGHP